MSLMNKFKEVFNGGCIKEEEKKRIDTANDALELLKQLKEGKVKSNISVVEQLVHWIDVLQQDMNIIKAHKIRDINADLTGVKTQLCLMADEMLKMKKDIDNNSKQSKKAVKVTKQDN